jgi:hypothetical protein
MRAVFEQLFAMDQSSTRAGMLASVRERIWRDIDNAHHLRLAKVNAKSCGLPKHKYSMKNGACAPFLIQPNRLSRAG